MHEKSFEPISAMMDGEIEEFELRRVIERVSSDDELKDKWARYHLTQDIMQGRSVPVSETVDLVSRVSAALEAEPSYSSTAIDQADKLANKAQSVESNETAAQWWKPLASMAVAASVTAAVLLGAQGYSTDPLAQPGIDLADVSTANAGFPQGRFGTNLANVSSSNSVTVEQVTANSMGQNIQLHRDLMSNRAPSWQATWLPQGFSKVTQRVSDKSEVLLYSNGSDTVSVNVEPLGVQVASQSVVTSDNLLAFGISANNKFITVVGDVSVDVAAKIAASVSATNK